MVAAVGGLLPAGVELQVLGDRGIEVVGLAAILVRIPAGELVARTRGIDRTGNLLAGLDHVVVEHLAVRVVGHKTDLTVALPVGGKGGALGELGLGIHLLAVLGVPAGKDVAIVGGRRAVGVGRLTARNGEHAYRGTALDGDGRGIGLHAAVGIECDRHGVRPLGVKRHVLGHGIIEVPNVGALLVGIPALKDIARAGGRLGLGCAVGVAQGLRGHRAASLAVKAHGARLGLPLGIEIEVVGEDRAVLDGLGALVVGIPTLERKALARRIPLALLHLQAFLGKRVTVLQHLVVGVVVVEQVDKNRAAYPVGLERHVAVHSDLVIDPRAVQKPAVESVVVAHGARQVGGGKLCAGIDRERVDLLGVLGGIKRDGAGLHPFGIEGKVAGHRGVEVVGLGACGVLEPAVKAITLVLARVHRGRLLAIRDLGLGDGRVAALVLNGVAVLLPDGLEGDAAGHRGIKVVGLAHTVERPVPKRVARLGGRGLRHRNLVPIRNRLLARHRSAAVGIERDRISLGRPLGIEAQIGVGVRHRAFALAVKELAASRACRIGVPAAKGVSLARGVGCRLLDLGRNSLPVEHGKVHIDDRGGVRAVPFLGHIEHHAVLGGCAPLGNDRGVGAKDGGRGHGRIARLALLVGNIPAVKRVTLAGGHLAGQRRERAARAGVQADGLAAVGERAIARIERDRAHRGVGDAERDGHVAGVVSGHRAQLGTICDAAVAIGLVLNDLVAQLAVVHLGLERDELLGARVQVIAQQRLLERDLVGHLLAGNGPVLRRHVLDLGALYLRAGGKSRSIGRDAVEFVCARVLDEHVDLLPVDRFPHVGIGHGVCHVADVGIGQRDGCGALDQAVPSGCVRNLQTHGADRPDNMRHGRRVAAAQREARDLPLVLGLLGHNRTRAIRIGHGPVVDLVVHTAVAVLVHLVSFVVFVFVRQPLVGVELDLGAKLGAPGL